MACLGYGLAVSQDQRHLRGPAWASSRLRAAELCLQGTATPAYPTLTAVARITSLRSCPSHSHCVVPRTTLHSSCTACGFGGRVRFWGGLGFFSLCRLFFIIKSWLGPRIWMYLMKWNSSDTEGTFWRCFTGIILLEKKEKGELFIVINVVKKYFFSGLWIRWPLPQN